VITIMVLLGEALTEFIPTIGVFGVAALRLKPTANSLASSLITFRFYRDSVRRLTADMQGVERLVSPVNATSSLGKTIDPFEELTLNNVSFTYQGMSQNALQNISLRVSKGEALGLIGPSGSGKTTLVDLLLGLLEPQSGKVKCNGFPLWEVLSDWRAQVAYLPQQVFLIDNTLRCNVALGETESEIEESRLQEALRQARLSELVEQLPQGVNTILGERGVRLSGGQRQRIALARAFYHGRSVLVMDEATSALDNETEREIVEEIKRLKGQKTMIVIAHRLTTVQHCDRIYRLEQGRIIEEGTPEQVLQQVS
jgi:ABC-type multidrug transport system fused ATPase/permease subunit